MWIWLRRIAIGLTALIVLAVAGLYGVSEAMIRSVKPDVSLPAIAAATDAGAVLRGEQLGRTYGCTGCHQPNLQGEKWEDDLLLGRLYPANLTRELPAYSDAQLARAIRQGVRRDGAHLWGMPSESWIDVSDTEMADLIAWLRSHSPAGEPTPKMAFGPLGRLGVITGEFKPAATHVAKARAEPSIDAGPMFARGRHIAATVCSECHGSALTGSGEGSPDLMIAAAYDFSAFQTLMRTGIGADGKEKGLMTEVARSRFVHLSDQDEADLHAYLVARTERVPAN